MEIKKSTKSRHRRQIMKNYSDKDIHLTNEVRELKDLLIESLKCQKAINSRQTIIENKLFSEEETRSQQVAKDKEMGDRIYSYCLAMLTIIQSMVYLLILPSIDLPNKLSYYLLSLGIAFIIDLFIFWRLLKKYTKRKCN